MRILIVNKYLNLKGGSEKYCYELSKILKSNGHKVAFFGMKSEDDVFTESYDMVSNVNLKNSSIRNILKPFSNIYSFESRRKIKNAIISSKPDIVHLNNYNYQLTPSILYEISKLGVPVVQTVHDPQMVCPHHRLYNYKNESICELCSGGKFTNCAKTKCIQNSFLKSSLGTIEAYLYRFLGTYNKKVDLFIYPSQYLKTKQEEMGFTPHNSVILSNFANITPMKHTSQKGDYVLYFGRISSEKGLNTLYDVIRETPEVNYVFVGTGPMEDKISKLPNVKMKGFLVGDALYDVVKKAQFSILPSIIADNCPLTIIESYQMGTPVIGSSVGGITELIENKKTGLLFESGNKSQLKKNIKVLYNNYELIKEYSDNCIKKSKSFSASAYYESLLKIYNSVIATHNEND